MERGLAPDFRPASPSASFVQVRRGDSAAGAAGFSDSRVCGILFTSIFHKSETMMKLMNEKALGAALTDWLRGRFSAVFPEVPAEALAAVAAVPAANTKFGDYQCNAAMPLAKALHKPPRAVAEAVVNAGELPEEIASLEIAGPGFLNIRLTNECLAARALAVAESPTGAVPQCGAGHKVVIDYSSPNVAKPMHIGHIRSTVIGNALDRLHRALGYEVIADNHIGDWGTQFGIIIKGYREFLDKEALARDPIEELQRIYVKSYGMTKAADDATEAEKSAAAAWLDACRLETVKLQQGDPENRALWQEFIRLSMGEFERVYRRLDVRFDTTRGESYYQDQLAGVVEDLEKAGLSRESEGAQIVDLTADGLDIAIVRKRDGGFNYTTTDIATVATRMRDYAPERIVYVTDERQQLHFKQFFFICRKMGLVPESCLLSHVWFGLMRLPEGTISTRQGNLIKLETLLDEAETRARKILAETRPDMPEEEARTLAAQIGVGAVKYADLSQSPQTMITFTWDKALALEGNSGPYLQYAHARIHSVLEKYAEQFPGKNPADYALKPELPEERALALKAALFPETVKAAADAYRPCVLADYLYSLSQAYSSFYQQVPFLKAEEGVRESRIRLCGVVESILKRGLGLLGIAAPDRM